MASFVCEPARLKNTPPTRLRVFPARLEGRDRVLEARLRGIGRDGIHRLALLREAGLKGGPVMLGRDRLEGRMPKGVFQSASSGFEAVIGAPAVYAASAERFAARSSCPLIQHAVDDERGRAVEAESPREPARLRDAARHGRALGAFRHLGSVAAEARHLAQDLLAVDRAPAAQKLWCSTRAARVPERFA
jgi:hypothetical protein